MAESSVTMSLSEYSKQKKTIYRHELFLENVLASSSYDAEKDDIVFDTERINQAMKLCFPETHKKRLATLRTQHKRHGT